VRILVVEDNLLSQKATLALLRHLGYRVDVASGGLEALEAVLAARYDVVILDLQMPDMDGFEVAQRIRAMRLPEEPKLVAMTASALVEDRERCLEAGMEDFLRKPVQLEELRDALKAVVRDRYRVPSSGMKKLAVPARPAEEDQVLDRRLWSVSRRSRRPIPFGGRELAQPGQPRVPGDQGACLTATSWEARREAHALRGNSSMPGRAGSWRSPAARGRARKGRRLWRAAYRPPVAPSFEALTSHFSGRAGRLGSLSGFSPDTCRDKEDFAGYRELAPASACR
jgi:CheY-like chemotaxis protein